MDRGCIMKYMRNLTIKKILDDWTLETLYLDIEICSLHEKIAPSKSLLFRLSYLKQHSFQSQDMHLHTCRAEHLTNQINK